MMEQWQMHFFWKVKLRKIIGTNSLSLRRNRLKITGKRIGRGGVAAGAIRSDIRDGAKVEAMRRVIVQLKLLALDYVDRIFVT
mmetsp:Transcript_22931/g.35294  ORF Transcript_22931/g.35294 Transcript_22931/m.35294 type:complete len:83 (-) Transcript_22931:53-301(-)